MQYREPKLSIRTASSSSCTAVKVCTKANGNDVTDTMRPTARTTQSTTPQAQALQNCSVQEAIESIWCFVPSPFSRSRCGQLDKHGRFDRFSGTGVPISRWIVSNSTRFRYATSQGIGQRFVCNRACDEQSARSPIDEPAWGLQW